MCAYGVVAANATTRSETRDAFSPATDEAVRRSGTGAAASLDGQLIRPARADSTRRNWVRQILALDPKRPVRVIKLAQRFARRLAERTDGVVYDPQDDSVTWPRGGTRRFKVEAAETIDIVELEWFVRREDAAEDVAEVVFDGIESFVPEASPRRFGSFEPLQHRLDEVGKSGFAGGLAGRAEHAPLESHSPVCRRLNARTRRRIALRAGCRFEPGRKREAQL
jgi:hypothetical protein